VLRTAWYAGRWNRSPVLPAFAGPHTLVVVSSYSGTTAETLASFAEAVERGCRSWW
jgi:glucose-6-phosphate isomerase